MASEFEKLFLEEITREIERDELVLPALPDIVFRIKESIDYENADFRELGRIVSQDAALSARLIRVANSSLLRSRNKVSNLTTAITRMGSKMLQNVINSVFINQMFRSTNAICNRRLQELQFHSTQVAAISSVLAPSVRLQPDQALLAGLVHDIGALSIIKRAEYYPELLQHEDELENVIQELHTSVGALLLKKWCFPIELIKVAAEHEDIWRNNFGNVDYVDLVIAANLQSYVDSPRNPYHMIELSEVPAIRKLGLGYDVHADKMKGFYTQVSEVRNALVA